MADRQTETVTAADFSAGEAGYDQPRMGGLASQADDDGLSDAMIRAGADILLRFHREDDNEEEVAARIYRAMWESR